MVAWDAASSGACPAAGLVACGGQTLADIGRSSRVGTVTAPDVRGRY